MTLHHSEHHFESSETVRDIVIGMADGLTVPFALAAGLTGAVAASHLIVIAGLAEIAAGSIAMGLGGYLAARGDAEHYASERAREEREIVEKTDVERHEVLEILESYGVTHAETAPILDCVREEPQGLGGLDDALRAWSRRTSSRPRRAQRRHHRRFLHRGRPDSAHAVHADAARCHGFAFFRRARPSSRSPSSATSRAASPARLRC